MAEQQLDPLTSLPTEPQPSIDALKLKLDALAHKSASGTLEKTGLKQGDVGYSDLDYDKFTKNLGANFRLEKGEGKLIDEYNSVERQNAYNEAVRLSEEQGVLFGGESGWNPFKGEIAGFINQAVVGELGGGTIEGAGYLLDTDFWYSKFTGAEYDWKNSISDFGNSVRESTQENTPIYQHPEGGFWADGAWAQGGVQLASSLSLMIPAAGFVRGVTGLANATKVTKAMKGAGLIPKYSTPIAEAIVSRHTENLLEGAGVYKEQYQKYIDAGKSEEEASALADKAASTTYKANWILAPLDMAQYVMLGRNINLSKAIDSQNLAKAAGLSKSKGIAARVRNTGDVAKQMLSEGLEEGFQYIIAEEAKHQTDVMAGIADPDSKLWDRVQGYLGDDEFFESVVWGSIGGGVFAGPGKWLHNKYLKSKGLITEEQSRINEIQTRMTKMKESSLKISDAAKGDNESAYKAAKREAAVDMAMSSAAVGNFQIARDNLESIKNATPAELAESGLDETFQSNIEEMIAIFDKTGEVYKEVAKRTEDTFIAPVVHRRMQLEQFSNEINEVKSTIADLETKIPRVGDLSLEGKSYLDTALSVKGIAHTIRSFELAIKDAEVSPEDKVEYTKAVKHLKDQESILNAKLASIKKSKEFTKEDIEIVKATETGILDDLIRQKSRGNQLKEIIKKTTNELVELNSPIGKAKYLKKQQENYEKFTKQQQEGTSKKAQEATKEDSTNKNNKVKEDIKKTEEKIKNPITAVKQTIDPSTELGKLQANLNAKITKNVEATPLDKTTVNVYNGVRKSIATPESVETASNDEVDYVEGSIAPDITYLSEPLGAAYMSARNEKATGVTLSDENKALTDFLESNIDLTQYTLEFEVDTKLLKSLKVYEELKKAYDSGSLNEKQLGSLPVKGYFMKDGKRVTYGGDVEMGIYLHDADYKNFEPSLKVANATKILQIKRLVLDNTSKGGKVTSKVESKSGGYLLSDDIEVRNNVSEVLGLPANEITLAISANNEYIDSKGVLTELETYIPKTQGAVYALVSQANGEHFPLRLFTSKITEGEANIIHEIYTRLVSGKNPKDLIDSSFSKMLIESEDPQVKSLSGPLKFSETSYLDVLNMLVYEGNKTESNKNPLYLRKGQLTIGNKTFTKQELVSNKTEIINLLTARTRQIDVKRLNEPRYNKYLINNNILATNASITENSNLFHQPLITISDDFKVETGEVESKNIVEETVDLTTPEAKEVVNTVEETIDLRESITKSDEAAKDLGVNPDEFKSMWRTTEVTQGEFKTINLEEELAWLKKNLPNVPVTVLEKLIKVNSKGTIAHGRFVDGMIELSKYAEQGTSFHEAFHAVFELYLTPQEQNTILEEASKKYGIANTPENRIPIHEKLAEEFRLFMLDGETIFDSKSETKGLFNKLWSMIKNIFSRKLTVDKLFKRINKGYYRNSKPYDSNYKSESPLYRVDGFTEDQLDEVTNVLIYVAFEMSNVNDISDIKNLDFNQALRFLLAEREKAKINKDVAKIAKLEMVLDKFANEDKKGVNYKSPIFKSVSDKLSTLGIVDTNKVVEEKDEDAEDELQTTEGGSNFRTKPMYASSQKDNATANIKLLIAMMPDIKEVVNGNNVYNNGDFLGLPKFVPFNKTWNLVKKTLADKTDAYVGGKYKRGLDLMLETLDRESNYFPNLGLIASKVRKFDANKKAQFFVTMAGTNMHYSSTFVREDKGWHFQVGNPDIQSSAKEVANEWSLDFKDAMVFANEDGLFVSEDEAKRIKAEYEKILNTVNGLVRKGVKEIPESIETDVLSLFNEVGVGLSKKAFMKAISEVDKVNDTNKLLHLLKSEETSIHHLFTSALVDLATEKRNLLDINGDFKSPILNEKGITFLSKYEALFRVDISENMVLGPEGNMYYGYSNHSSASQLLSEWKQSTEVLQTWVESSPWVAGSVWAQWMLDNPNKIEDITFETFNNFKELGEGDQGVGLGDIKHPDEYADRIIRLNKGIFVGLAKADKGQDIHIKGFPIKKSSIIVLADGKLDLKSDSDVMDVMMGYVAAELGRIKQAKLAINEMADKNKILYYHFSNVNKPEVNDGNAFKHYLFPDLAPDKLGSKKDLGLYDGEGIPLDVSKDSLMNNEALKTYLKDLFLAQVTKELTEATKLGLINFRGGKYSNNSLDTATVLSNGEGHLAVVETMGKATLNGIVSNVEHTMLFVGDPALFKSKGENLFSDFNKRTPLMIAGGLSMNIQEDMPIKYNSAVVNNIIKPSEFYTSEEFLNHYAELAGIDIKQAKAIMSAYKEVNITDAQAWITLDAHKVRAQGYGKWTPAMDEAFNLIKAWEATPTKDLWKEAHKASLRSGLITQPWKTVHVERALSNGVVITEYNKQSESVLNPLFTSGQDIDNLRRAMENSNVDHVIVLDGKKVGAQGITDIASRDENGIPTGLKYFKDIQLNPKKLHYKNLFLQQDLPVKGMKPTLVGSQIKKNILANIQMDGKYVFGGEEITGNDLVGLIHATDSMLSDFGKNELLESLGYNAETGEIDFNKLRANLVKSYKEDGATENLIEALETMPIEATPQYRKKIQNKLAALINKATVKLKMNGGSFIQLSNFGYADLNKDVQKGVIWLKDKKSLNPPNIEFVDGRFKIIPGQILLPHKMLTSIKGWRSMSSKEILALIDKDALQAIGYRIPNQGTSSNDLIEIVGFLPPSAGDTIVAYSEITTKTGSDFDIDKQYIIVPNWVVDEKTGMISKVKYNPKENMNKEQTENMLFDLYVSILSDSKTFPGLVAPLDDPWLSDDLKELFPEEITTGLDNFRPSTQLNIKRSYQGGKFGVGQTANQSVDNAISQYAEVYLNGLYLGRGNHKEVEGMRVTDLSAIKDENGNLISGNLSAYMNAYVDIAKDPYIARGNHNTLTANVVFMLIRAGVDRKWVNRFIAQPIIKQFVEVANKYEGTLVERPVAINLLTLAKKQMNNEEITKSYGPWSSYKTMEADPTLDCGSFSTKELEDSIKDPEAFGKQQIQILDLFIDLQDKAKKLANSVLSSKADTNGMGKNLMDAYIIDQRRLQVIEDGLIGNFQKKFEGTMLGTYYKNSVEFGTDLFGGLFFETTAAYRNVIDTVLRNIGQDRLMDAELGSLIVDELYTYMITDFRSPIHMESAEMNEMLKGKNSLGKTLRVHKLNPKSPIHNNLLVQYLKIIEDSNVDYIGVYKTKSVDTLQLNKLTNAWKELLNNDNPKIVKFGEDLVKYSFITSGFKNNLFSFYDLIPTEYLKDKGFDTFIKDQMALAHTNDDLFNGFTMQFFKNNATNTKLVPKISGKLITAISDDSFSLDSEVGENYIIGVNEDGSPEYRRLVMLGNTLYSLSGYSGGSNGDPVYTKANGLGYNYKGKYIKEYSANNQINSSLLLKNNVSLLADTIKFKKSLFKPQPVVSGKEKSTVKLKRQERLSQPIKICIING